MTPLVLSTRLLVVGAVFANRAQPVSAADVLDQLQAEAFGRSSKARARALDRMRRGALAP
jgi:hypothetical protein